MLLSVAINEAARFMHRSRPAITEEMLVLSCERCGGSFTAEEITVVRRANRVAYPCPNDGGDLVRVRVGKFGKGGGDIECDQGSVRVRLGSEDIDWVDFMGSAQRRQVAA
ncbi:MAG TPA: hypothetical protein VIC05_10460 [Solirubrobacteraceae bacterium]|jgi:hypothetical protein